MRKLILLLLGVAMTVTCQIGFAQPGYLGRKNIVQADLYAWPGHLLTLNYNSLQLNHSESLSYYRVVSRRSVIGLGLTYLQLPEFRAFDRVSSENGTVRSRSLGIAFQFKWYPFLRSGRLAPIGPYIRVAVNLNNESSEITSGYIPIVRFYESHLWSGYQAEFGKTFLIAGHVPVDLGIRACLADFVNGVLDAGTQETSEVAGQINGSEFLKIHIGAGYLF